MVHHRTVFQFALILSAAASGNVAGAEDAPQILALTPALGDTDVDPGTTVIRVTFDRDMGGGMWGTGGGEQFPQTTGNAHWVDRRTCVLPVKLEPAKVYSLGINSQSYKNFKSADGVPAPMTAIYFATTGSSIPDNYFDPPEVVSLVPTSGATGLEFGVQTLSVTFDRPMQGGFSWVVLNDSFPKLVDTPAWSDDRKTCTANATLLPGTKHTIGLNHEKYNNFRSEANVPLEPKVWTFETATE